MPTAEQSIQVLSARLLNFLDESGELSFTELPDWLNFAAKKPATVSTKPKKKKNCTAKSRSCGYSCVKQEYNVI